MKGFIIVSLLGVILTFAGYIFFFILIGKAAKEVKTSYERPDTTISIHNGKPDTVITKKSVPFWLR